MTTEPPEQTLSSTILEAVFEQKPENVNQLARIVHDKLPNTSKQQILDKITELQNDGKLKLTRQPQHTPPTLRAYLKTFDATWYWITLAVTFATIVAVFTIPEELQPYIVVRYILGTVFILWLPGYAFIKALFPKTPLPKSASSIARTVQNLDTIERVALSIGMSLALVPMIGLLLNYTPWGITLTPITLSLSAVTLVFATAAVIRAQQTQNEQATGTKT